MKASLLSVVGLWVTAGHAWAQDRASFDVDPAVEQAIQWELEQTTYGARLPVDQTDIITPILRLSSDADEVTVFDRIQKASDRPESLDLIDGARAAMLVHPAESLNTQAGVNIHRGSGQEHLTAIRSPVLTGGAGAGSFLYLQNGVPLRAAGFANVNGLFEAGTEYARTIEVIKGPGPAEYGSNAVHGLINVVTPGPERDNSLTLTGSTRGFGRLSGGVSLTPNLRINASLAHDDGFRDDSGFDQQKIELRTGHEFGAWTALGSAQFTNLNQETAGFLQGDDAYRDRDLITTNAFPEAFRDGKSYRAQLDLSRPLGDLTLNVTPYARRNELRFLRHFVPGQALEKNGHTSIGVQTSLLGDDWSVGAQAEYTDGFLYEFQDNPSRFSFVQGLHFDYDVGATILAGYGQKTIEIDRLKIDLGARAEYTHYDYTTHAAPGRSGRFVRSPDRTDDYFTLTPKLGLIYELSPKLDLVARAARGSRAPQTTDLYAVVQNQDPGRAEVETLDSVEAGLRFADEQFDFELTGYAMRKDNFFFRNASGFNVVDGKTNHLGVELSSNLYLTDWLWLEADWSLSDQSYDFDDPSSGIVNGLEIDTAPSTLGTTRVNVGWDKWSASIEWRHVGAYFTNPANTQDYPGHDLLVLRGDVDVTDKIRVFARVDNLLDTRYADRADFAFGNERYFPGRQRTVFAGLSMSWE